jgi:hypothetical protein
MGTVEGTEAWEEFLEEEMTGWYTARKVRHEIGQGGPLYLENAREDGHCFKNIPYQ